MPEPFSRVRVMRRAAAKPDRQRRDSLRLMLLSLAVLVVAVLIAVGS